MALLIQSTVAHPVASSGPLAVEISRMDGASSMEANIIYGLLRVGAPPGSKAMLVLVPELHLPICLSGRSV